MKRECIEELIKGNREIEFKYHGRKYSITYYNDARDKWISVCEFYKEPTDVKNADEVLKLKIGSYTLEEIFAALPDSAFEIYEENKSFISLPCKRQRRNSIYRMRAPLL